MQNPAETRTPDDPKVVAQSECNVVAPVPTSHTTQRQAAAPAGEALREVGGPSGLEPTRYGDWERKGRCIDF
jgi:hypothetical protein